ncbi:MAG: ATPase [Candidatus Altiarchaeales archaeon]|nr:ATPase [Candidatus Altiarchaeales archaeon]MBD3416521.1 ATPase [Candidatus Altiarchaeales archaeon]
MAEEPSEGEEKDEDYISIRIKRDMLHTKLGGAMPYSSMVLIEGKDGMGKSLLVQRLLYAFLVNGASATYISTELSTKDFLEQMESLQYVVDEWVINQTLLFIPMFPFIGGGKLRSDFLDRLLAQKELYERKIIIIDTLSFLLVQGNISQEKAFDVIKFFKKIANKGKIVIFTVDPEQLNKSLLTLLRSVSDIYLMFGTKQLGGETKKYMEVNRFKRSKIQVVPQIAFRVEPGQGMIIDIGGLA